MHKVFAALLARLFTHKAVARVVYVDTVSTELQDAVARTCIDNVADWGIPRTLQAWNRRQYVIATDVAARFAVDVLDVLPRVAETFPKVCPRVYNRPVEERLAHASILPYGLGQRLGRDTARALRLPA